MGTLPHTPAVDIFCLFGFSCLPACNRFLRFDVNRITSDFDFVVFVFVLVELSREAGEIREC